MRLIDSDCIYDAVESRYRVSSGIEHRCERDFLDLICSAETVDAVEVKHGRWVIEKRKTLSRNPYMDDNYHAHATCSECGFCIHSENASFGYPELNTTNYCPNCGAKMDGDGNG